MKNEKWKNENEVENTTNKGKKFIDSWNKNYLRKTRESTKDSQPISYTFLFLFEAVSFMFCCSNLPPSKRFTDEQLYPSVRLTRQKPLSSTTN